MELLGKLSRPGMVDKIDQSIAQRLLACEINRHVDKVIRATIAVKVQHLHQRACGEIFWQIADDECGWLLESTTARNDVTAAVKGPLAAVPTQLVLLIPTCRSLIAGCVTLLVLL